MPSLLSMRVRAHTYDAAIADVSTPPTVAAAGEPSIHWFAACPATRGGQLAVSQEDLPFPAAQPACRPHRMGDWSGHGLGRRLRASVPATHSRPSRRLADADPGSPWQCGRAAPGVPQHPAALRPLEWQPIIRGRRRQWPALRLYS